MILVEQDLVIDCEFLQNPTGSFVGLAADESDGRHITIGDVLIGYEASDDRPELALRLRVNNGQIEFHANEIGGRFAHKILDKLLRYGNAKTMVYCVVFLDIFCIFRQCGRRPPKQTNYRE